RLTILTGPWTVKHLGGTRPPPGLDARGLDYESINPPLAELEGMRPGWGELLERRGAHAVDLHSALLDETARLGGGGDEAGFLDDSPQRPPSGLGRQHGAGNGSARQILSLRGVAAEQRGGDRLGLPHGRLAVHERGHLACQHALRLALLRRGARRRLELRDPLGRQEREVAEE